MDIDKLINEYFDINKNISELKEKLEMIKAELKLYMKSQEMEKYNDKKGNLVSYKVQKRKSLLKSRVRELIEDDELYNSCFRESEFEVLRVMSKEQLEQVKKFINK